jgi:hypothetical protein
MISKVQLVVFRWFGCLRWSFVEEGGPWWGACVPRATVDDGVVRRRFFVIVFCFWVVLCFVFFFFFFFFFFLTVCSVLVLIWSLVVVQNV